MKQLPERAIELLNAPNFANLATIMPDGSPQVTPVWVDTDGAHVMINTARGRQKARNLERNARVALDVLDRENPYVWLQIRGHVVELTETGAEDHIRRLSAKYTGSEEYPLQPGERRVMAKIAPDHVALSQG